MIACDLVVVCVTGSATAALFSGAGPRPAARPHAGAAHSSRDKVTFILHKTLEAIF